MVKTENPDFDLDAFIPYRLNRASERVSLGFSQIYRGELRMTRPEWRVLANLGQYGTLTAKQICEYSTQHKTKVSRAVQALEDRKWLKRSPNPDDRREEWLELTGEGMRAYRFIASRGQKYDEALFRKLGSAKTKALLAALDALEEIESFGTK